MDEFVKQRFTPPVPKFPHSPYITYGFGASYIAGGVSSLQTKKRIFN